MFDDKRYEPEPIPVSVSKSLQASMPMAKPVTYDDNPFAEVEVAGAIHARNTEAIPAPQTVPVATDSVVNTAIDTTISTAIGATIHPAADKTRRRFNAMRQIARDDPARYIDHNRIHYHRDQRALLSRVFYKQGRLMEDFTDDFDKSIPFFAYYPYYQLMDYDQLRTYFTWRTRLREGYITKTATSYAFVYVYELINNIGVQVPSEGLSKLLAFWQAYKGLDPSLDKYILRWLKDYHIYYVLPHTFGTCIKTNGLHAYYAAVEERGKATTDEDFALLTDGCGDSFALLAGVARYDIRRSHFYSVDYQSMIHDCFNYVIECITAVFAAEDIDFYDLYLQTKKKQTAWYPFDAALFFPWQDIPKRRVILSPDEIYICRRNAWHRCAVTEGNKRLIGYIMRRMETALRVAVRFTRKMTGTAITLDDETLRICYTRGISLDAVIDGAVSAFYAEYTKITVSVDTAVLDKVRREAQDIQEKLMVADTNDVKDVGDARHVGDVNDISDARIHMPSFAPPLVMPPSSPETHDEWLVFFRSLTGVEAAALCEIINGGDIQSLADTAGIMTEVLIDEINQKALDAVGDNVLEYAEQVTVFAEYRQPLQRICGSYTHPSNTDCTGL